MVPGTNAGEGAHEPPFLLDTARVLHWALLDKSAVRPGTPAPVVEGLPIDLVSVSRLVVTEDLLSSEVALLHCNDDWQTVAAGRHADPDAARAAAVKAYGGMLPAWNAFRALTDAERREIETTRAFLRDIATNEGGFDL